MPFLQPIYDLVSPQLAHGRIALMGDAAFVARPHVGMGVAKAGDDAVALAACITAHGATPEALRHYDALRRAGRRGRGAARARSSARRWPCHRAAPCPTATRAAPCSKPPSTRRCSTPIPPKRWPPEEARLFFQPEGDKPDEHPAVT